VKGREAGVSTFWWIFGGGLLMSLIALVGAVTLLLRAETLQRLLLPLVALAAGSLLGGAVFHLFPASLAAIEPDLHAWVAFMLGFTLFMALEQFLHWRHCTRAVADSRRPLTYLVLLGDGLHNFIGGLAIASAFLVDLRLGITAWVAAAAHEIPQELGDFGVLVHGGWSKGKALLYNVLSATSFLLGGLLTYALSGAIDVSYLIPFAAGNFVYIAAADLVPEVNKEASAGASAVHTVVFLLGAGLMYVAAALG
jgi:zinc and cadmium transporter